jgi:hypothetical protein
VHESHLNNVLHAGPQAGLKGTGKQAAGTTAKCCAPALLAAGDVKGAMRLLALIVALHTAIIFYKVQRMG